MSRIYGPRWPWLFALYVSLAVICGYQSWSRIVIDQNGVVWNNQSSVDSLVSGLSDHPIGTAQWAALRSRVLVPLLIVDANKYFGIPYRVTHDGTRLLFIFLALLALHWHLRAWFSPLESLAGAVIVIASVTITFNGFYPTVTDFPELLGMTCVAALLVRRRWGWMLAALFITTLNRETSIVLVCVALCFLYEERETIRKTLAVTGAIFVIWLVAFLTARHLAGVSGDWFQRLDGTMTQILMWRRWGVVGELIGLFLDTWPRRADSMLSLLHNPHPYNVNWSIFLVLNVFWVAPLVAWRSIPHPLKRLYLGGLLGGVPIFLLVGVLNEAGRHMVPLYPLVLPAGLYMFSRFVVAPAPPLVLDSSTQEHAG